VRELCRLAAARHGLRTLRAATSRENTASQKVLTKAGFIPAGPADPASIGGKQGTWYQRDLTAGDAPQPERPGGATRAVRMKDLDLTERTRGFVSPAPFPRVGRGR
jgi:hypothetical protein